MPQHIAAVCGECICLGSNHASVKAPLKCGHLIAGEVESATGIEMLKQRLQSFRLARLAQIGSARQQITEQRTHLFNVHYEVDDTWGKRAWHRGIWSRCGILYDYSSAGAFHLHRACRAIGTCPCQNYGDQSLAVRLGGGSEE